MKVQDYQNLQEQIEDIELNNNMQDYNAFIFWFIEVVFGLSPSKILDAICDGARDKGIDAVIIDDRERNVIIIQSKYERLGQRVQIKDSEIKLFATVKSYFSSRRALNAAIKNGNEVTKRLMKNAFDAIRKYNYTLELLFVTTHKKAPHLDNLVKNTFGFKENEFIIYDYDRIMQLYYDKMRDFTPSLGVYNLPLLDTDKLIIKTSPHKSWVISVRADEINLLVNKYSDNLFRKNVRNFLGKSRTNKKIIETLEKDPTNFWYYNNGITILCDQANVNMEDSLIRINNPQIVNGCQTVKSIQNYGGDLNGELMVRVIQSTDHEFINYLTLYQNSSNPVRNRDLKSNDPIQVKLKNEFKRKGIYYEIKRGEDYKTISKKYPSVKREFNGNVINNEHIAKCLAAIKLGPAIALRSGSDRFFGDDYHNIFDSSLSIYNCLSLDYLYDLIKNTYRGSGKRYYSFEKDWVFKNRALFYVLAFIYDSLGKDSNWEKDFVLFYDDPRREIKRNKFDRELIKVINKYFKYIYNTWDKVEYYNAYLQKMKTKKEINGKYKSDIKKLSNAVVQIFDDIK